jgi:hypothetical protein
MSMRRLERDELTTKRFNASRPGSSRLSTSLAGFRFQDVDARHKAGHDKSIKPHPALAFVIVVS